MLGVEGGVCNVIACGGERAGARPITCFMYARHFPNVWDTPASSVSTERKTRQTWLPELLQRTINKPTCPSAPSPTSGEQQ